MQYKEITPENLISEIRKIDDKWDFAKIQKALNFAIEAHKDQFRKSGENYIVHPVNTAYILAELEVDTDTIVGGLLHDILEDTNTDFDTIAQEYGTQVAELVDGLTKISDYEYKYDKKKLQAENFRKLLISISKDIRVIMIKLADRLHNMRTLQFKRKERRIPIAQETLDIYAPLANRFGIAKLKWELEDLCLKYLYPKEYAKIISIVDLKKVERENYIIDFIEFVRSELLKQKIVADISGRTKHFYSIFRKNRVRKIPYDQIYDLAAIRVIVATEEECYRVLGIVQSICEPIGRYRNYIAQPKPNGYQSLHITVLGPKARKVEVQIRTKEMHIVAEEGVAAHWRYKEFTDYSEKGYQKEMKNIEMQSTIQSQRNWIGNILQKYNEGEIDDFVDYLKFDLYSRNIITLTPEGDLIKLPLNATPVDFAFAIHSEVGLHTTGAKVNGVFVPISTRLKSGDKVEIITSKAANPGKNWLNFMKSSRGRQKVRAYFRNKQQEDAYIIGKEIFKKKCRKYHIKYNSDKDWAELLQALKINDEKTLYIKLGTGELLFQQILDLYKPEPVKIVEDSQIDFPQNNIAKQRDIVQGIKIDDIDSLMLNYAKCCNPLPGDEIVGYVTRGKGITVHRQDCSDPSFINLQKKESERILPLQWNYKKNDDDILHKIKVVGKCRKRIWGNILTLFDDFNIMIEHSDLRRIENRAIGHFSFYLADSEKLYIILEKIRSQSFIEHAEIAE